MSHYSAEYYQKQRIIREIRQWCELILKYGNPTFVVQGLKPRSRRNTSPRRCG